MIWNPETVVFHCSSVPVGMDCHVVCHLTLCSDVKPTSCLPIQMHNCVIECTTCHHWLSVTHALYNIRIYLQERIKNANKTYFMLQNFLKNKNISSSSSPSSLIRLLAILKGFPRQLWCAGVVCHCLLLRLFYICSFSVSCLFLHQHAPFFSIFYCLF